MSEEHSYTEQLQCKCADNVESKKIVCFINIMTPLSKINSEIF